MTVAASAASTKTMKLHFFSKGVYFRLSDPNGKPLAPNSEPAAGDRLSTASNDYIGNHTNHAKRPTASDHIVCTFISTSTALCDGTIAVGGSLIIGDDFVLNFNSKVTRLKITGGTGRFGDAHGTVVARSVGKNTDLTVKVRS